MQYMQQYIVLLHAYMQYIVCAESHLRCYGQSAIQLGSPTVVPQRLGKRLAVSVKCCTVVVQIREIRQAPALRLLETAEQLQHGPGMLPRGGAPEPGGTWRAGPSRVNVYMVVH